MIEIRRILCPTDFSEGSRHALDHAVAIARWYDSSITVMHVSAGASVLSSLGPPGFEQVVVVRPDPNELLKDLGRFIAPEAAPGVRIDPIVREGPAAAEILAQAAAMRADLLVLGTHGRSGFERLLLGSVTERMVRTAACPVLTVPPWHPDAVPASPVLFKRILCAIDFSDCSLRALEYALSMAQEADAHLTVLHVLAHDLAESVAADDFPLAEDVLTLAEYRRRSEESANERLRDVVPEGVASYCEVETLTRAGKPAREILRLAEEAESDLIVLGVEGRGRAGLVIFGSTANQVVREAVCPVLTLRDPGAA